MHAISPRPPANEQERESIAQLIDDVFVSQETTTAFRSMSSMDGFDPASLPTVWDANGVPLATVQAVPCEVSVLGTWLPAGIITMVATAEHARGQGLMRTCMLAAHRWMLDNNRNVGILYGVPEIYPKFGYRPLMPRTLSRYGRPKNNTSATSRPATDDDAHAMADLFNRQEQQRPCAVKRGIQPWIWRSPTGRSSLRCIDQSGKVAGYFCCLNPELTPDTLTVVEAACLAGQEANLLDAIHGLAAELSLARLELRLMPDHQLVNELVRRVSALQIDDVEQVVIPPQAGMLALVNPGAVLEGLRPAIEQRLAGRALQISAGSDLNVTFGDASAPSLYLPDPADLAHVLCGYPGLRALQQWGRVEGDQQAIGLSTAIFPSEWPRWVLAPFWDE